MRLSKLVKWTALGLSTTMMLSGCGSTGGSDSGQGNSDTSSGTSVAEGNGDSTAEQGDKPTVTIALVPQSEMAVYDNSNYAINWVEEQTGIHMEFVLLPSSDARTKLNLMLNDGSYPDVILYGLNKQDMLTYAEEGIFIPINDLYEQYGDNYKKLFEERPQYEGAAYAPDGNMYGFLDVGECYHCQAYPKLWYNTEWLQSMGLSMPETIDEFEQVLTAAKNSDYNGNGQADEIPLTGAQQWDCMLEWYLMNSFIPVDKTTMSHVENGKIVFSADKDEFKEGLAWMHKLYEEGLIDPTAFSQKADQMQQVIRFDQNLVFAYVADHFAIGIDMEDRHMNEITTAMLPLEGPNGLRLQPHNDYVDSASSFNWFITDNCKDPVSAFKLGDFLMGDEASMVGMFGEEGTYWGYLEEETPSVIEGTMARYWSNPSYSTDTESDYWGNIFWTGMQKDLAEFRASYTAIPEDMYAASSYEARLFEETTKLIPFFYEEYLPKNLYMEKEDYETFTTIQTSLQEYIRMSMAQFITGELNLDSDWDSYVDTINSYGLDTYLSLYQAAFDEYNANN